MKPRAAALLTSLYSRSWRSQYGAEFQTMLRDVALTPAVVADVVFTALGTRKLLLALCFAGALAGLFADVAMQRNMLPHAVAVATPRPIAVAACRVYSSVVDSQFDRQHRCLT